MRTKHAKQRAVFSFKRLCEEARARMSDFKESTGSHSGNAPSKQRLSFSSYILLGGMLFTMFFGAGNLILPPLLGLQAGSEAVFAMAGFLAAGIGLPVLAILALANCGSLKDLAGRVGPRFGAIFCALVYLTIGPFLAIPRTATTSFEMVIPLLPEGANLFVASLIFSLFFFGIAYVLAIHPGSLSKIMGKFSAPLLIVLIIVVVTATLLAPDGQIAPPQPPYDTHALTEGFLTGYQTVDLLSVLCLGIVVAINAKSLGATEPKPLAFAISMAGIIAGVLMGLIYCGLAFVGAQFGTVMPDAANGAELLAATCALHFGSAGSILVAAIFLLACLNVCTALTSCCAEYFYMNFPGIPLKGWAAIFAGGSCLVSLVGLNAILQFSVPLLNTLYPPAIVLVLLGLFVSFFDKFPQVWPWAVGTTAVASVLITLCDVLFPETWTIIDSLPFADTGFGWLLPAFLGLLIGFVLSRITPSKPQKRTTSLPAPSHTTSLPQKPQPQQSRMNRKAHHRL